MASTSPQLSILVIGGGVAGPVAALAIQRAGHAVTIFERNSRESFKKVRGSYFTLSSNALDALDQVGALGVATRIGTATSCTRLHNEVGALLAELTLDRGESSLVAMTCRRWELARDLMDVAVARGVPVEYGKKLVGISYNSESRVVAHFEDGTREEGDVLVGADGVHSVTRRLLDPDSPAPRYVGLTNFGGRSPKPPGLDSRYKAGAWHMVFGRKAFFGFLLPEEEGKTEVVWFANVPEERGPRLDKHSKEWSVPDTARLQQLSGLFAGDLPIVAELIETSSSLDVADDPTYDLGSVPRWHDGRACVLVGDAAHAPAPTSGQGAALAIEDGIVLAMAIRDAPDVLAALPLFEAARRQRVEAVVAHGAQGSSNKAPGPVGRALRSVLLPLLFKYVVTDSSLAWIYDYRCQWDTPLPETLAKRHSAEKTSTSASHTRLPLMVSSIAVTAAWLILRRRGGM